MYMANCLWVREKALSFFKKQGWLFTLGYGHIAPSTQTLRLTVILYALIGLPLTMVFLANIGGIMADFITYLYSRGCCRWCRVRRKKTEIEDDPVKKLTLKNDEVGKEDYMPTEDVSISENLQVIIKIRLHEWKEFCGIIYDKSQNLVHFLLVNLLIQFK